MKIFQLIMIKLVYQQHYQLNENQSNESSNKTNSSLNEDEKHINEDDNYNGFLLSDNNPNQDELYIEPEYTIDQIAYGVNNNISYAYLEELDFDDDMDLILKERVGITKSLLFKRKIDKKYDSNNLYKFEKNEYESNIGIIFRHIHSNQADHIVRIALYEHLLKLSGK